MRIPDWLARRAGVGHCARCDRCVWNPLINVEYLGRQYHLSCALRQRVVALRARWIVRNAILTPSAGNGEWTRHATRLAAIRSRRLILEFKYKSGFYAIPTGGLIVCRAPDNLGWWRSWIYYWGPSVVGNDQLSSDRISDRGGRKGRR